MIVKPTDCGARIKRRFFHDAIAVVNTALPLSRDRADFSKFLPLFYFVFIKEPITTHVNAGLSGSGSFNFVYTLPVQINPTGVKATFVNGILNLELPKVVPTIPETVKVPITAG